MMNPLAIRRLALVSHYGPEVVSFRGPILRDLVSRGIEVYALAPAYEPEIKRAVLALGAIPVDYPLDRTGTNPVRDVVSALCLARQFREIRPEAVLAYGPKPVIYATPSAWLAGVPKRLAVITGLGHLFSPNAATTFQKRVALLRRVTLLSYKIALSCSERVFFQNRDDLEEFHRLRIIPPAKAVYVGGTGVDLVEWKPAAPVVKPVTFVLAARLLREKGVEEYATAARRIRRRYRDTRFILLGPLDTRPGAILKREVEEWVTEGILEWPGCVPDVRPWLAQASVYVLPSYYREGVPRSIQEAMAMARPIITTDAPGCRETVIDGQNGFLVPVRDAEALATAMEQFIMQPELIVTMGRASRLLAEERYDVRRINAIIMREMGI
jgi:glycosyltransferase involved in cell wall biosynthesis